MGEGQEEDVLSHEEMALLDMTESMYMQQQGTSAPQGSGGCVPPPHSSSKEPFRQGSDAQVGSAHGGGGEASNPPQHQSVRYSPYSKSPVGQPPMQHRQAPPKGPGGGKEVAGDHGGRSPAPRQQQQQQQQQHAQNPPNQGHQGANPQQQQHPAPAQQHPPLAVPAIPVANGGGGGGGSSSSGVGGSLGGGVGALPLPVGAADKDSGPGMLPPHPTVDAFRSYQQFVNQVLDKNDVEYLGGKRIVKRGGWRKLALAFGVSFEMQSEETQRDQQGNVVYSKFVFRAILPNGRFSDGWGACCPNEKKFAKVNHDVPATAETRAKNRACADLFGIGDAKR